MFILGKITKPAAGRELFQLFKVREEFTERRTPLAFQDNADMSSLWAQFLAAQDYYVGRASPWSQDSSEAERTIQIEGVFYQHNSGRKLAEQVFLTDVYKNDSLVGRALQYYLPGRWRYILWLNQSDQRAQ